MRAARTCLFFVLLSPPLEAGQIYGAWEQDKNPCAFAWADCDLYLQRIFDSIIQARKSGDTAALDKARRRLFWSYWSYPEKEPAPLFNAWLVNNGINPCTFARADCDLHLQHIFNSIIQARKSGDIAALDKARRRLFWYYW